MRDRPTARRACRGDESEEPCLSDADPSGGPDTPGTPAPSKPGFQFSFPRTSTRCCRTGSSRRNQTWAGACYVINRFGQPKTSSPVRRLTAVPPVERWKRGSRAACRAIRIKTDLSCMTRFLSAVRDRRITPNFADFSPSRQSRGVELWERGMELCSLSHP